MSNSKKELRENKSDIPSGIKKIPVDEKFLNKTMSSAGFSDEQSANFIQILKNNNAVMAGGFPLKIYIRGEWEDGDIDIWVKSGSKTKELLKNFLDFGFSPRDLQIKTIGFRYNDYNDYLRLASEVDCIYIFKSDKNTLNKNDIQIISLKEDKNIVDVINNFDLSICRLFLDEEAQNFIIHSDTMNDIRERMIKFDGVKQGLYEWVRTCKRILKYIERDFDYDRQGLIRNINKSIPKDFKERMYPRYPDDRETYFEILSFIKGWNRILQDYFERKKNYKYSYVYKISKMADIYINDYYYYDFPIQITSQFSSPDLSPEERGEIENVVCLHPGAFGNLPIIKFDRPYSDDKFKDFFVSLVDLCNTPKMAEQNMIYKYTYFWYHVVKNQRLENEMEGLPNLNYPLLFFDQEKIYFYKMGDDDKWGQIIGQAVYNVDKNIYEHVTNRQILEPVTEIKLDIDKCFDLISYNDNVDVVSYLRDKKGLALIVGDKYYCIQIDQLISLINNTTIEIDNMEIDNEEDAVRYDADTNIFFACDNNPQRPTQGLLTDIKNTYVLIRIVGNYLVPLFQVLNMIKLFMEKQTRFFKIVETDQVFNLTCSQGPAIAFNNTLKRILDRGYPPNALVSADHCQLGSDKKLYNIQPLVPSVLKSLI